MDDHGQAAEAGILLDLDAVPAREEGMTGPVEPWDWRLYSEKLRQRRHALDEAALKQVALMTQAEYFYGGTAQDLKKVYQGLSTRLVVEKKETEISALFAAFGALLVAVAAALSVAWFGRVT